MNKKLIVSSIATMLACGAGTALAAAPDWGKVPSKKITVFYPGVSPIEWIVKGTEHGGAKGLKKGESCASCHDEEAADMGKKMATGQKLEPNVIKGKAGSIPVTVQAANDGTNLYMRFTWKEPAASGGGADKENQVKLAFMLEDNKVERANLSGCWETCHQDARTMPGVTDDKKTKYVTGGSVASGKFYDLLQWKSKANKGTDGYVADKRVMEGGKGLVEAKGEKKGDTWTVTFTRKLAGGGEGDIAMASGKLYNFGFAIHDDQAVGRFHHVSLGYTLGIDAKADITAGK
ncbi:ethylbenzene dehydrogenase-related protein [Sulfurisoma sediminicola]|uniref:Ethylbenzene dehydrogenase n=1 Tax=Sulfurisoma sediminicola TaxID=1381557 RepID=A0A497X983_9PROT|nr:ethylbenzene dehydrogenase-related protein [Sulfurisoma sediminicola]RLJ62760.1 ethylbenzene dehydrogenase [Sulfurisoma sediminicola]